MVEIAVLDSSGKAAGAFGEASGRLAAMVAAGWLSCVGGRLTTPAGRGSFLTPALAVVRAAALACGRRRRIYAYAACAGALGSGAVRVYWAAGRGGGLPGDGVLGVAAGWGAATLCLLAAAVALATVAPWGRAIPRPALLALAWTTCAALLLTAAFGLAGDDVHWTGRANQVLCLVGGVLWFATARGYQRHTRGE